MKASFLLTALTAVSGVAAQVSMCDKYTIALFVNNNEDNQRLLLTKVVNTVLIGNYSANPLNAVPGIFVVPATFKGQNVNLLQYFNGRLTSTNRGGACGTSVDFLDGGGATPLMNDKPANCVSCKQRVLVQHLYKFFAALLGCSIYGTGDTAYNGVTNMYSIHKYMALDAQEVGYFIEQVGLSASSFGVTPNDVSTIKNLLSTTFGSRCAPPSSAPRSSDPAAKQAICSDCNCPLADNADCSIYGSVIEPKIKGGKGQTCSKPKTCPSS